MSDSKEAGLSPAELVRIEALALHRLADSLQTTQAVAFEALLMHLGQTVQQGRRLVLCGIGKSGLIARKITATLISLGVPAVFLHAAEAVHGDLGVLSPGDTLLALTYSGETAELLRLLPLLQRLGITLTSFCGCAESTVARASLHTVDVAVEREACAHQLAPTASTTVMLALGDALAVQLSARLGFAPRDFAELHPGGQLGRRLSPVRELMHSGDALPCVLASTAMPAIIHEMSAKRLGMTTVQHEGELLGVLSDGDLRRLLERRGPDAFHATAADIMNPRPRTISPETFAAEALELMEQHKITSLIVTAEGNVSSPVQGVVHMHDLLQALAVSPRRE